MFIWYLVVFNSSKIHLRLFHLFEKTYNITWCHFLVSGVYDFKVQFNCSDTHRWTLDCLSKLGRISPKVPQKDCCRHGWPDTSPPHGSGSWTGF